MKKLLTIFTAAACAATMSLGLAACAPNEDYGGGKVSLVAVNPADVGTISYIDYYVAAEPAATTRANAAGLFFAGDLQELYGSDNGYPQAVIVAKNSLVENNPAFLAQFIEAMEANVSWLASAEASTVISAVSSHLPEGTTPTFNEKNLTAEVIANCGINFVGAGEDKERVEAFLAEMAAVDASSVGQVSDEFFCGQLGTASSPCEVSVYAPDGAPALALAKLMAEENTFSQTSLSYNIVASEAIGAMVTGEDSAADICILPLNAASKLLGSGERYKMLGTVTNGNLYILSKAGEQITAENISSLAGKTVGVIQLANVPGLTFKIILDKYDLGYEVKQ